MENDQRESVVTPDVIEEKRRKKILARTEKVAEKLGYSAEEGELIYTGIYGQGEEQLEALKAIFDSMVYSGPFSQAEIDQFEEAFFDGFRSGLRSETSANIVPLRGGSDPSSSQTE